MAPQLRDFLLSIADNNLILGHRLSEWCGHGPVLEQDIAMTNIALDLIGEARHYYQYLAETDGMDENDYAMKRDVRAFKNVLLVEQKNGHWGDTIIRQLMYDCFHYFLLEGLVESSDKRLAGIAKKSVKEVRYHLVFSSEWVIRLGDGTSESHEKMQASLDQLMPFFDEMFIPEDFDEYCVHHSYTKSLLDIKPSAHKKLEEVLQQATLQIPTKYYPQKGGKKGVHTEHLGYILTEMQYLQKSYPDADW
ncbi:MAG: 1,2-phenylacetyl-CoA epoxidase subunit PaaC [Saprospiraceae bacterium]